MNSWEYYVNCASVCHEHAYVCLLHKIELNKDENEWMMEVWVRSPNYDYDIMMITR